MGGVVFPDSKIQEFIKKGIVKAKNKISDTQIQPSSLDLRCRIGGRIWHMPYSQIPRGKLTDILNKNSTHTFDLNEKKFLHKKTIYVIELEEELDVPNNILVKSNPKSTTGRSDIHVRLLTENGDQFDFVREGYKGKLFLEVVSNSFDLYIPRAYSFNQIRFFKNSTERLNQGMLEYLARSGDLLITDNDSERYIREGAVNLTLSLDKKDPGYKLRDDAPSLDLSSKRNSVPFSKFFERVNLSSEGLVIIPNSFYLLKSNEIVKIPKDHCAEMADISTSYGEFRAHYAGFFDPNFKSVAVMEVRNNGTTPFLLKDGQIISSLWFYKLTDNPTKLYGKNIGSNYQGQNKVMPAKFFKVDI